MHLFFTNLHRRHSIRTNEIFKIRNTLRNPSDARNTKIKVILNPIKIPSSPSKPNVKSRRQKIFQPPLPVPPFFSLSYRRITFSTPKQYPISSSFNPQIYFHKFPPWRKTISSNWNSSPPPQKISCILPIVDSDETTPEATTRDKQRSFSPRKLSV